MINNMAKFEFRHVLYCDLLGFSDFSLSKFFDPGRCFRLFRALDKAIAQANVKIDPLTPEPESQRVPDYVVNPEAIYFSDAIVVSTPATNVDAIWLCQAAAMIQNFRTSSVILTRFVSPANLALRVTFDVIYPAAPAQSRVH